MQQAPNSTFGIYHYIESFRATLRAKEKIRIQAVKYLALFIYLVELEYELYLLQRKNGTFYKLSLGHSRQK